MPFRYPIQLDVTARRAAVIGGGAVGGRKAAALFKAGCRSVTVVSPELRATFSADATIRVKRYDPSDLGGIDLAFAATDDPAVNTAVVADCRLRNILVNRADSSEDAGDFATVAAADFGPISITVSAGSPALSAMIRDRLVAAVDPKWPDLAAAMETIRPMIRDDAGLAPGARKAVFRKLATDRAAAVLAAEGVTALLAWALRPDPEPDPEPEPEA